jgi:hypothetical protein
MRARARFDRRVDFGLVIISDFYGVCEQGDYARRPIRYVQYSAEGINSMEIPSIQIAHEHHLLGFIFSLCGMK